MPSTYDLIQTVTVSSNTTSGITFSSIPQTYTDLVLVTNIATSNPGQSLRYRINGYSGSNYFNRYFEGVTTTASVYANTTAVSVGFISDAGTPTTDLGSAVQITNFPSYTNTNGYKISFGKSGGNYGEEISAGSLLYNFNAITSIGIYANDATTGQINVGSILSLYGIKAA